MLIHVIKLDINIWKRFNWLSSWFLLFLGLKERMIMWPLCFEESYSLEVDQLGRSWFYHQVGSWSVWWNWDRKMKSKWCFVWPLLCHLNKLWEIRGYGLKYFSQESDLLGSVVEGFFWYNYGLSWWNWKLDKWKWVGYRILE